MRRRRLLQSALRQALLPDKNLLQILHLRIYPAICWRQVSNPGVQGFPGNAHSESFLLVQGKPDRKTHFQWEIVIGISNANAFVIRIIHCCACSKSRWNDCGQEATAGYNTRCWSNFHRHGLCRDTIGLLYRINVFDVLIYFRVFAVFSYFNFNHLLRLDISRPNFLRLDISRSFHLRLNRPGNEWRRLFGFGNRGGIRYYSNGSQWLLDNLDLTLCCGRPMKDQHGSEPSRNSGNNSPHQREPLRGWSSRRCLPAGAELGKDAFRKCAFRLFHLVLDYVFPLSHR